ncbi:hypothetical protein SYNTR_1386 [Candidatus Syntrophocurvum alkaliphilum]|uniref:Uncharacterized protein n=1 Tax=Candidatus Syntrophocurvum alkaliphilum TaxID=2293317 RepID=A0A6I6DCM0_9FIRM|nr:hypothetical protein [Candidatus Syntrophocurvum alkaliphilum]QGT99979.1 hypothetical protein SYNTR_1386 [Candidatus Syntrophocurvum alkaliphilum]
MRKKKVIIVLLFIALYFYIIANHPNDNFKKLGYNQVLEGYSVLVSRIVDFEIIYGKSLRDIGKNTDEISVKVVLPNNKNYEYEINDFLTGDWHAIVQCSAMDTWHTSELGSSYLHEIYNKGYRVVVFDGGHHLPTIGLNPDIVIIPVTAGYAAHGYMQDGMKVLTIKKLFKENNSNSVLVTIPRWALVKTEYSLTNITKKIIQELNYKENHSQELIVNTKPRISKLKNNIYVYINSHYYLNQDLLIEYCRKLDINNKDKIYVAFDYGVITLKEANEYVSKLQDVLNTKVVIVNEPIRVSDALIRWVK